MEEMFQFVGAYGYIVIVVWVMMDQIGVLIPAIPVLIVAGAMAGAEKLDFTSVMTVEELEDRHDEIPRDRDVVLYCT
jgi:membrane protein DedA with SNARE-associated domain